VNWKQGEDVIKYMSAGNHPHRAFKSHRLVGQSGNVVTLESEPFDGARFVHSYTPTGQDRGRFRVDRRLQTAQTA